MIPKFCKIEILVISILNFFLGFQIITSNNINDRFLDTSNENPFLKKVQIPKINSYFEVKLTIGEFKQVASLALDLTESYTWVKEYSCEKSEINRILQVDNSDAQSATNYNTNLNSTMPNTTNLTTSKIPKKSSTCIDRKKHVKIPSIYGEIEGDIFTEDASLGSSSDSILAKNFSMITVDPQTIENYFGGDRHVGVLGLSYKSFNGLEYSFLNSLVKSGSISKKIFAMGNNKFHIGNYPTEVKQFSKNYHTCNLTMNEGLTEELMDGWICDLTHFSIGKSTEFLEAEEIEGRVIFDSMLINIEAPEKFLGKIKSHYIDINYAQNNCSLVENTKTYIVCQSRPKELLDLNFIIGGYALIIPGENLFTAFKLENNPDIEYYIFNVVFTKQKHNVWRFGKLLLDEYLIVFDAENSQVGFYGENKINFSVEWKNWWESGYTDITSQEHMKYLIIASVALGAALLFVIICLVCQAFKSKSEEEEPFKDSELEVKNNEDAS